MTQSLLETSYFYSAITVANTAALKAIDETSRHENSLRVVVNLGNNLPPNWYQFKPDSTLAELIPAIVAPDSGTGRWVMLGMPIYFGSNIPDIVPPLTNIQWIFDNKIWQSVNNQSVSDWIEITTINTGLENGLLISQEGLSGARATALVFGQAFNVNSEGSVFYINIL
jgi:hypothetical protein